MPYKMITKMDFSETMSALRSAIPGEIHVTIDDGYLGEGDLVLIEAINPFDVAFDGSVTLR